MRTGALLLVLVAGLLGGRRAEAAPDPLKTVRESVLKALDDKDPKRRAQAFQPLQGVSDPRGLDIAVEAGRKVEGLRERLRAEQAKAEAVYEKAINDLDELEQAFALTNDRSSSAAEAYNKRERKLSETREKALGTLTNLENEAARLEALLDGATAAAAAVLAQVDGEAFEGALDLLDRAWLRSTDPTDPLRFLDAVGGQKHEGARRRVRLAAADGTLPFRARAAAVAALASLGDESLPEAVLPNLALGQDAFVLVRASVAATARVHRPAAIAPLIAFLGREDLGALRTDAHEALQSLTGEKHGPYRQPWEDWWKQAQASGWRPPEKPTATDRSQPQGKGVTFYGINTFSERILFVLDVSGSMDKPDAKDKPQPDRITVAKKELLGAVANVDNGKRFNVLMFNHEVLAWQPGMVVASEDQRRKAKDWIESRAPTGGTNIHDALEAAFGIALRATGEPLVDTLYFVTDGTPTAGKLQDPKSILAAVEDWNRSAHLTIHCVAVGEADHEFLKSLAALGNGQFLRR